MIYPKNIKKPNKWVVSKQKSCCSYCCSSCAALFHRENNIDAQSLTTKKQVVSTDEIQKMSMLSMSNEKLFQYEDVPVSAVVKDPPSSSITIGRSIRPIPLRNTYLETQCGGEYSDED